MTAVQDAIRAFDRELVQRSMLLYQGRPASGEQQVRDSVAALHHGSQKCVDDRFVHRMKLEAFEPELCRSCSDCPVPHWLESKLRLGRWLGGATAVQSLTEVCRVSAGEADREDFRSDVSRRRTVCVRV